MAKLKEPSMLVSAGQRDSKLSLRLQSLSWFCSALEDAQVTTSPLCLRVEGILTLGSWLQHLNNRRLSRQHKRPHHTSITTWLERSFECDWEEYICARRYSLSNILLSPLLRVMGCWAHYFNSSMLSSKACSLCFVVWVRSFEKPKIRRLIESN